MKRIVNINIISLAEGTIVCSFISLSGIYRGEVGGSLFIIKVWTIFVSLQYISLDRLDGDILFIGFVIFLISYCNVVDEINQSKVHEVQVLYKQKCENSSPRVILDCQERKKIERDQKVLS